MPSQFSPQITVAFALREINRRSLWFSDKADEKDVAVLDRFINEKVADGWEFVTYNYMGTSMQIKGAFIITFRKQQ